jgi:drug/metabolite transporter (DMT)-like permease
MPPTLPFWLAFVTTVLLLVASLATGWLRRRRPHLWLGPLTMVSLAVTIVLTEQLMRRYEFPQEVLRVHLWFAKAGGLLALPVIATGVWLWRSERARLWHKIAVLVWLVAVLSATGTGLWLFSHGTVKA